MADCIFCKNLPKVMENELAYLVYDINPISKGHALIIPKRHFEQIFEATQQELAAMHDLVFAIKDRNQKEFVPDGYNIWVNCGSAAGQVVMHAHIHFIPRYKGEVVHIREHLKGNIE
jgi:diadenosine tetraphosphate (Ap4A) HIT family hydrolase